MFGIGPTSGVVFTVGAPLQSGKYAFYVQARTHDGRTAKVTNFIAFVFCDTLLKSVFFIFRHL